MLSSASWGCFERLSSGQADSYNKNFFFIYEAERKLQSMLNYSLQAGFLCNRTLLAHRNSSQLSTLLLVISGINVTLSITATLGNVLILIALHKESSLNPPSNLFLRCLTFSDLCVGLVVQPVGVVSLMAAFYHRWNLCHVAELLWYSFSIVAADFSLATLSAISVDRLLALSLGIRYKQVVTMKRARLFLALFLLLAIGNYVTQYVLKFFAFLVYSALMWIALLITSMYCYTRIYLALRNHIEEHVMHQSIETPTPWVPGKGRGFDIDPSQKASISLPPKARVQIKSPYP